MTLARAQYAAGVRIAGIGDAANNSLSATVWATRGSQQMISTLSLNLWRADCLVSLPQTVERRVDPWASRYETSPMSFELSLDLVGDLIPVQGWEPIANLLTGLVPSSGSVRLGRSDLTLRTLYIAEETIKLGSVATFISAGVWEYTLSRGMHGSRSQTHAPGEPLFAAPPEWRGRQVELLVVRGDDGGNQPRVRWAGFISNITTSQTGTCVVLECREVLDALTSRQIGAGAPDLADRAGATIDLYFQGRMAGELAFTSRAHKEWVAPRKIVLQIGDSLWVGNQISPNQLDLGAFFYAEGKLDLGTDALLEENFGAYGPLTAPIYELLVVSRDLDGRFGAVSFTHGLSPAERYHPLAIAFALLTSTPAAFGFIDPLEFDIVAQPWAINVWEWLDVVQWANLIAATPEIQIDQLFLGWDGKPVAAIELIVDRLLRPYGFFLTIAENGKLGVARLLTPTIKDLCEAATRQVPIVRPSSGGQFEWSYEVGSAVGEVTALVGATPWAPEPSSITVRPFGQAPRGATFAETPIYTYDLSTRSRAQVASFADGDRGDELTLSLIDRAVRASWALPRLKITALDSRAISSQMRYDLGAFVTLAAPVPPAPCLRLPTGERADLSDPEQQVYFLGQILGARQNLANQTWDLELLLVAWRTGKVARFRAPSAVVIFVDGLDIDLEVNNFGSPVRDSDLFAPGDEVSFYSPDGAFITGPVEVGLVEPNFLFVTSLSMEPPPGSIVRLASAVAYANTASAVGVTCSDRPWFYLADAVGEIERPVGAEGADLYG